VSWYCTINVMYMQITKLLRSINESLLLWKSLVHVYTTIYNFCFHMRWTSEVVNPRVESIGCCLVYNHSQPKVCWIFVLFCPIPQLYFLFRKLFWRTAVVPVLAPGNIMKYQNLIKWIIYVCSIFIHYLHLMVLAI
jgi:hypothetical protein